jgi:pantoate--beta-alanine ligase
MVERVFDPLALRARLQSWRQSQLSIALVPTMGALHQGHLDLVARAKQQADKVVVSLFVNPTQFAPHEDFALYPRDLEADCAKLAGMGCDLLYAPATAIMYPAGHATTVSVAGVSARLEGTCRPHFFAGVATIVTKLLCQARPDVAVFGEKDWQQLQVVTTLARDLDLGVDILGVATRREADGLAMSSRNAYLSKEQRAIAPALKVALDQIGAAARAQPSKVAASAAQAKSHLLAQGFDRIDYLEACHATTLEPWRVGDPLRVLGAAWLGQTRLIDNCG